jgi:alginate O-acetyltransferase complex protein AlgI
MATVSAYRPQDFATTLIVFSIVAGELLAGFALTRRPGTVWRRLTAWIITVSATTGAERITAHEPAGVRMLAIILTLLQGMKIVVAVESDSKLSLVRWLGFCLMWFGMRPALFATTRSGPLPQTREVFDRGVKRLLLGAALIGLAATIWMNRQPMTETAARWLATPPLMVGLSLAVHFGLFNILAAYWRWHGVDCRPLFKAPVLSTSLNEFWSKRWNVAFSEMTAIAIYRPASALGRTPAVVLAFVASGVLHELAISVPVKEGYGLPSLYFLLHGGLVAIETAMARRGWSVDQMPALGRIWTLTWIVAPMPILFHLPFLRGIVWPVIGCE